MKLLIDEPLIFVGTFSEDRTTRQAQLALLNSVVELLRKCSVYLEAQLAGPQVRLQVLAQKVMLDEVDMNELFSDALSELFELELRYAALGGAGCDFAMTVVKGTPRALPQ